MWLYENNTAKASLQQEGARCWEFIATKAVPVYAAELGQPLQACTTQRGREPLDLPRNTVCLDKNAVSFPIT